MIPGRRRNTAGIRVSLYQQRENRDGLMDELYKENKFLLIYLEFLKSKVCAVGRCWRSP
jgi:hypothetical protein